VEFLRSLEPDIVCVQEVNTGPPFRRGGGDLRCLERGLGMRAVFGPAFGLRWWGFGNAVFTKLPVLLARNHTLPNERERLNRRVFGERRRALEVRILAGPETITVFCTHLGLDSEDRMGSADRIVKQVRSCNGPVVVTGDLNCVPEAPEFRSLLDAGSLIDAGEGGEPTFPAVLPQSRIDYILHSEHVEIKSCRVVPSDASDHLPLVAEW
jgi:endonuclease/exonuclease/phosphatase family metal-dependent hydrolase